MTQEQLLLDLPPETALSRADFLVTAGNRDAVRWLESWPGWPAPALILTGEAGCGKTHLARVWQDRSHARLLPLTEALILPPAILTDAPAVPLILDAIDSAALTPGLEEAFVHLYKLATERGISLLLLARQPLADWGLTRPDLVSRLRTVPQVQIAPPDEETLAAVMIKLFADRQKQVDAGVIAYLLPRMERSFVAACRVVAQLDAAALREHAAITVPFARRVLMEPNEAPCV
jgi:chromosomal replication initiation ATPase DnaA